MKNITAHHDGHGLNEQIEIEAMDKQGPGGAHHRYSFNYHFPPGSSHVDHSVGYLQFQEGPRNVEGSTPGVTTEAVIAMLIDHIEEFQAGEYACEENVLTLYHLQAAKAAIRARAYARAQRGVLGTYAK
jgi:hypothetical protein